MESLIKWEQTIKQTDRENTQIDQTETKKGEHENIHIHEDTMIGKDEKRQKGRIMYIEGQTERWREGAENKKRKPAREKARKEEKERIVRVKEGEGKEKKGD